MFYDERIEKTKGEISKRAIFISMIISLVTGIIHCVNLVRNSPGGWYYFLAVMDVAVFFGALTILLIGYMRGKLSQRDERTVSEQSRFYNKAATFFAKYIFCVFAFAMPVVIYIVRDRNFADQSFDQIIYTLFFIVGIYVICNFRSQDICFNYSIIDSGNYYKGVFKNILKLAVYVLEMLLISMAAVILLVIAADPGSAFIVSMILQIVIYYVCSLIEIGTIYLLLSFLERRSYKSDKYVSSATVISLCVTIFIYAVYTAAVIFIDSQPISQTNALMLISAVSIIKTYIKSAFLIFMTYFGYEYQKKRRNRLLSGACITVILSEIFYVFASQIANGLIYVYMPEIMDNDAYVINNILSNTKMLIDGLLKIGDAVGLALVIIALTKDKVIHRSNRLAVLAFVLFGGIEAFLFTQTDILRVNIYHFIVEIIVLSYFAVLMWVISKRSESV